MAKTVWETSHFRISWPTLVVDHTRIETMFDLQAFGIKELAIRRSEKNLAVHALGRHLFGAWINACVTRGSTAQWRSALSYAFPTATLRVTSGTLVCKNHKTPPLPVTCRNVRSIGKGSAKVGTKKTSLEFRDSFGIDGIISGFMGLKWDYIRVLL